MAWCELKSVLGFGSCQLNVDTAQPIASSAQPIEVSENFFDNHPEDLERSGFTMAAQGDIGAPPPASQALARSARRFG